MQEHNISGIDSVHDTSMTLPEGENPYVIEIDATTLDPTTAQAVAALSVEETVEINSTHVLQPGEVSAASWQCGGGAHREDRNFHLPAYTRPLSKPEREASIWR